MKSIDLWALLILSTMPEKPIPLEGVWRTCESSGGRGDLEYVASFNEDELVEDYFGREFGDGQCGGRRIFHFRRYSKLIFNNFNFKTEYRSSGYRYIRKKSTSFLNDLRSSMRRDVHQTTGEKPLRIKKEYPYRIRGETLEVTIGAKVLYFKRVKYTLLFKMKEFIYSLFQSGTTGHSE
jgi:hypothetical protein